MSLFGGPQIDAPYTMGALQQKYFRSTDITYTCLLTVCAVPVIKPTTFVFLAHFQSIFILTFEAPIHNVCLLISISV